MFGGVGGKGISIYRHRYRAAQQLTPAETAAIVAAVSGEGIAPGTECLCDTVEAGPRGVEFAGEEIRGCG